MSDSAAKSAALAQQILNSIPSGQRPFALSSEELPIEFTVDGRVNVLRADQASTPGSCNPPFSSWGN